VCREEKKPGNEHIPARNFISVKKVEHKLYFLVAYNFQKKFKNINTSPEIECSGINNNHSYLSNIIFSHWD
jgi:uncharacterized pyridoxamine 5'-phosphate oxidase family protein